jgi:hypothetical protein
MATNRNSNTFAEPVSEDEETVATPAPTATSGLKRARIRGTWLMHWGSMRFSFEDGKTYNIPADLFEHLKKHGNIYDTL